MRLLSMLLGILILLTFSKGVVASELVNRETVNVNVQGSGMNLKLGDINDFGEIELPQKPLTYYTSFSEAMLVEDLRGVREGWRLTVSATPFTNITDDEVHLPTGSLTLNTVSSINLIENGGTYISKPQIVIKDSTTIDDGEVVVLEAEEDRGKGSWLVEFPDEALGLTVDIITVIAGEYESELTWNLHTTP